MPHFYFSSFFDLWFNLSTQAILAVFSSQLLLLQATHTKIILWPDTPPFLKTSGEEEKKDVILNSLKVEVLCPLGFLFIHFNSCLFYIENYSFLEIPVNA